MQPYLICPTCGSDDIMKNGTARRSKQNYKCRDCDRQFVEQPVIEEGDLVNLPNLQNG